MSVIILGLGSAVVLASLFLMARPGSILGLLNTVMDTNWRYAAALVRLLLGAAVIAAADSVRYPDFIAALGWLMVLGGLLLVVITPAAMTRMVAWFGALSVTVMRLWLLVALLFGLFLVYASLG